MMTEAAQVVPFPGLERRDASETRIYAEDGWVFREHPGKRIECVCRYGDIESLELLQRDVSTTKSASRQASRRG
jgi:hypothetical protein